MAAPTQTRADPDRELAFAGAARQAEALRAAEVSASELVRMSLARIERFDPELNAFRKVFAEKALLEAEQAEARLKAGEERPLLGVPIAIKDEVNVAGEINMHGTDAFTEPAREDSEMVRRLREAGAIIVGLTRLPELAICGFTESATQGVTRNPWNPQRTPGGSSGGSAAAVAAGLVPIASAGDGGGSIRIPAASCGLFGLKPSRGRVSLAPDLEGWTGLAVLGSLSRTVLDSALWLDIVAGGSREPEAPPPPERAFVESARTAPGKLRVAWSTAAPRAAAPPTGLRGRQEGSRRDRRAARLRSGMRSASGIRPGEGSATTSLPVSCAGSRRPSIQFPIPSAWNGERGASGGLGAISPMRYLSARCAAVRPTSPASTRSSTPSMSCSPR